MGSSKKFGVGNLAFSLEFRAYFSTPLFSAMRPSAASAACFLILLFCFVQTDAEAEAARGGKRKGKACELDDDDVTDVPTETIFKLDYFLCLAVNVFQVIR